MPWINDDDEIIENEPEEDHGIFLVIMAVVLILMAMWGASSG